MHDAAIHLLGIRHHGPGSARATLAALDELEPDVVAIEAPAEAESVFGLVADDDLVPPVALLGYAVEHPERAAFYPLAVFCPEWLALRWAAANAGAGAGHGPAARPPRATGRPTARSTPSASWPPPPATTTPSAGGRTWSSTAAPRAASPASPRSPRRWRRSRADAGPAEGRGGGPRGAHAHHPSRAGKGRAPNASPWSAAPGTCRR